ncbi:hypothetical protein ACP4OV_022762 [Aristida adscensionis]
MGRPKRVKSGAPLPIRVVSRRIVQAADASIPARVDTFSNLDLIPNSIQCLITCIYPKPAVGEFRDVVAAFDAHLPTFLNFFFPLTGRFVFRTASGRPELHCFHQGTELVVGEVDVALASLDWGLSERSLSKIYLPYAEEVPLAVQLLRFACGGFAVVWATNNLIGDGNVGVMLVRMWAELVRTGRISEGAPYHDRSLLGRPRDPPAYGAEVAEMFKVLGHEREVNALTADESQVERLYYVEGRDLERLARAAAGADGRPASRVQGFSAYLWKVLARLVEASPRVADGDKRCRLLWWVDGRRRIRMPSPELQAALDNYAGNVTSYAAMEADAAAVLRRPLGEVAAMVREAINGKDYGALYQEMMDWVEAHRQEGLFVEASNLGLGSPTVSMTMWSSFPTDTDFGFGQASLVLPVDYNCGRMCSGLLYIAMKPGESGSWIMSADVWPRLAAALEEDEERVFKPLTAEYLTFRRNVAARPRL